MRWNVSTYPSIFCILYRRYERRDLECGDSINVVQTWSILRQHLGLVQGRKPEVALLVLIYSRTTGIGEPTRFHNGTRTQHARLPHAGNDRAWDSRGAELATKLAAPGSPTIHSSHEPDISRSFMALITGYQGQIQGQPADTHSLVERDSLFHSTVLRLFNVVCRICGKSLLLIRLLMELTSNLQFTWNFFYLIFFS